MHVAARERPLAGAGQPLAGAPAELAAMIVERPELGQVAWACSRWYAVISAYSGARSPFTRSAQATNRSCICARVRFEQAPVDGVADEDVLELVGVVVAHHRGHASG